MAVAPALSGRHRELSVVRSALRGQAKDHGGNDPSGNEHTANDHSAVALLVIGEAGVGKSRLVSAGAAVSDITTLSGWCLPRGEGLPFLPVVDVLHAVVALGDDLLESAFAACPAFVRSEIARLLPELEEPGSPSDRAADPERQRNRLFDGLRQFFTALGRIRPCAVIIEDVHWADSSTLDYLDYALTPGRSTGVPIVMTLRSEESLSPVARAWLDRIERMAGVTQLRLGPLSPAETAAQIELLLGRRPSQQLAAETFARSEGNPFFTDQLIAAVDDDQSGLPGAVPEGLTSLLLLRTEAVRGPAREVLIAMAVAARPLSEEDLAAVCGFAGPTVRIALQELRSRWLLRRPQVSDGFELRHALLAQALSDDLLASVRREVHLRVAQMLTASADSNSPAIRFAAQAADHFGAAGQVADELRWRANAARTAESIYASAEASAHWQRVIDLWDAVPDAPTLAGAELGEVYQHAILTTDAIGHDVHTLALAEAALARLGPIATGDDAIRLHTNAAGRREYQISFEAGISTYAEAIRIGENGGPTRAFVDALLSCADAYWFNYDFDAEWALEARALAAATAGGFEPEQTVLRMLAARRELLEGDRASARAMADAQLAIIVRSEDPWTRAWIVWVYLDICLMLGDLRRLVEVGQHEAVQLERQGVSYWYGTNLLRYLVGEALIELGLVDQAARLLDEVTDPARFRGSAHAHYERADLDVVRGRFNDVARFWDQHEEVLHGWPRRRWEQHGWSVRRAELALWQGRPAAALAEASATLDLLVPTDGARFAGGLFTLAMRACADLNEAGDGATAASAADRLAALLGTAKTSPFAGPIPVTAPAHGLGWAAEQARAAGQSDPVRWARTAQAWEELDRPLRAAYARWRQAEAVLAVPRGREQAAAPLRTAASLASDHVPLSQAIEALARRARIELRPPQSEPGAATVPTLSLTERERDVLRLLGEGRTNREIGAALFISTKTASVHVTNILRKLQVTSRVQAATAAERSGLLTQSDRTD